MPTPSQKMGDGSSSGSQTQLMPFLLDFGESAPHACGAKVGGSLGDFNTDCATGVTGLPHRFRGAVRSTRAIAL